MDGLVVDLRLPCSFVLPTAWRQAGDGYLVLAGIEVELVIRIL
jgi:hypothetical protein